MIDNAQLNFFYFLRQQLKCKYYLFKIYNRGRDDNVS